MLLKINKNITTIETNKNEYLEKKIPKYIYIYIFVCIDIYI